MIDLPKDNLAIRFRKLCRLINVVNQQTKSTRSSSAEGVELCRLLKAITSDICKLSKNSITSELHNQYSRGKGSMPRILWISFTNSPTPFQGLSVSLCFGLEGNGAVCGLMDAVGIPNRSIQTVIRKYDEEIPLINVDGTKSTAFYNNKFINPAEFHVDSFDSKKLISHFDESVKLLASNV